MFSEEELRAAQSEVLRLQARVNSGSDRSLVKQELYRKYEAQGQKVFVDYLLTLDAVFGGRPEMSEKPNVNIYGGNFANLNLGEQIGTINATVNVIASQGTQGAELAAALRSLTESIGADPKLTDTLKKEALEAVETIADQANLPTEQRRPGVFKAALSYLPTVLSATVASIKIWETVHPVLTAFFAG